MLKGTKTETEGRQSSTLIEGILGPAQGSAVQLLAWLLTDLYFDRCDSESSSLQYQMRLGGLGISYEAVNLLGMVRTLSLESLLMLRCPHPGCPSTFRSQHGRTYHFRVNHVNTNSRPVEVDPANSSRRPQGQRKEHPHLTGMCTLCSSFYSHTDVTDHSRNEKPFPATQMAISCRQVHRHILKKVRQKGTGHPSKTRSSSS